MQDHLGPQLGVTFAALTDDLAGRGPLDETLVVVMGEFGRTPKINGNGGCDPWGERQERGSVKARCNRRNEGRSSETRDPSPGRCGRTLGIVHEPNYYPTTLEKSFACVALESRRAADARS